jgi:hypothetical protein
LRRLQRLTSSGKEVVHTGRSEPDDDDPARHPLATARIG